MTTFWWIIFCIISFFIGRFIRFGVNKDAMQDFQNNTIEGAYKIKSFTDLVKEKIKK